MAHCFDLEYGYFERNFPGYVDIDLNLADDMRSVDDIQFVEEYILDRNIHNCNHMVHRHMDHHVTLDPVSCDYWSPDLVVFDHVTFDVDNAAVNTRDDSDIAVVPIQEQMTDC